MATYEDVRLAASSFRRVTDPRPWAEFDDRSGSGQGECVYWVQQDQLADALTAIAGTTETVEIAPGFEVTRVVPLLHHLFPALFAYSVRVEEQFSPETADPSRQDTGPQARITVKFHARGEGTEGYSLRISGTQEQIAIDGATFSGGGTPGHEVTRVLPGSSYLLNVADAPGMTRAHAAYLNSVAGSLNDAEWEGNPIGTVQFHPDNIEFYTKGDGSSTARYALRFDTRPIDFNYEFDRTGVPREVLVNGSPRYAYIDFNELIK